MAPKQMHGPDAIHRDRHGARAVAPRRTPVSHKRRAPRGHRPAPLCGVCLSSAALWLTLTHRLTCFLLGPPAGGRHPVRCGRRAAVAGGGVVRAARVALLVTLSEATEAAIPIHFPRCERLSAYPVDIMCGRFACRYHHGALAATTAARPWQPPPPHPPSDAPSGDCRPTSTRGVLVAAPGAPDASRAVLDGAVAAAAASAAPHGAGGFTPASAVGSAPARLPPPPPPLRRLLVPARWGLLRRDGGGDATGRLLFNARSEEMASRPTWSPLLRAGRRCVVPVEWWYEWLRLPSGGGGRTGTVPYAIHRKGDGPVGNGQGGMVPPADVPEAGAVGLKPEEGFSSSPVTVQPDVSAAHAAVKAESSTVKTEPRTAADVHAPVKAEPDSEAAEPLLTTADASVDGDAKAEAPSSPSPLVYLAGLYDVTDAGVHSFVLLTTAASVTEWLHPRSPVVLSTAAEVDAWLDPSTPVAQAVALAARPAFDSLSWTPVTSALSKPTGVASAERPCVSTLVAGCRPVSSFFGASTATAKAKAAPSRNVSPPPQRAASRTVASSVAADETAPAPSSSPQPLNPPRAPAAAESSSPSNAAVADTLATPERSASPAAAASSDAARPAAPASPRTNVHAFPSAPPSPIDAATQADAALAAALQREEDEAALASGGDRVRARLGLPARPSAAAGGTRSARPPAARSSPAASPSKRGRGGGAAAAAVSPVKKSRNGGGQAAGGGQRRLDAFFSRAS